MRHKDLFNIISLVTIVNLLLISCSEQPKTSEESSLVQAERMLVNDRSTNENIEEKQADINQETITPARLTKEEREKQIFGRTMAANDDDIILGSAEAKVTIIEYFSPTCPHCAYYHKKTFPELKKRYIDTGKITYIMREFVASKQDLDAAILARCKNDQVTYLKFINVILASQGSWAYSKNYREILTNIGIMGGVPAEEYATCLNDEKKLNMLFNNSKLASKQPKVVGTPAFFINGKYFSPPYSIKKIAEIIDQAATNNNS